MASQFTHQPVLLEESLSWLALDRGALVVDGTVGGGGHAAAILERTAPQGRLIALDVDADALEAAAQRLRPFGDRAHFAHASFRRLGALLADRGTVNQEEKLYLKEIRGLVREALILLDERERHIIRNRFGLLGGRELTLEEIGKTLNLSRERVRQLEREAKEKLRAALMQIRSNVRFSLA